MANQCLRVLVVLAAISLPGVGWAADSLFGSFLSEEDEKRIGAEQHPRILAEFGGEYDDPELTAYVDSIGQFLAMTTENPDVGYTFTVLDSPIVNAFALPGGYVYVTRGLLALAGNEAELAGVLAHEIGHVVARHGAERHGQSTIAGLGVALLGVLTESEAVAQIGQVGAMALIQGYSREQEFESDTLGVRYLSRAGFDPNAMSSFLSRLEAHSALQARLHGQSARQPAFDLFASHPRTADRVRRAIENAGLTPVANPIVARDIYLDKIDGMLFGDDPAQGVIRGQRFLHPDLGFRFDVPDGFQLINGQRQVTARGPDGAAIIFDLAQPPAGRVGSLTGYLNQVWFPDARFTGREAITVNGMPAATGAFRANVQNQPVDVRAVVIDYDGRRLYRFLFITPPAMTGQMNEGFRRTTYSFQRLSGAEAQSIRPVRLEIRPVRQGESVAELAALMPEGPLREERFRVLNGLTDGEALTPGRLVKVPREAPRE